MTISSFFFLTLKQLLDFKIKIVHYIHEDSKEEERQNETRV